MGKEKIGNLDMSIDPRDIKTSDEFWQARKPKYKENPEVHKAIEFSRYKQDCRKRALELAHGELSRKLALFDGKKANELKELPELDVNALADKYYNWLISIPEK